ncbi:uncharacterized protein LOC133068311 [Dama dama]|uniref:uncharacterized protein LOC133068311 n=1 Tax=Dama dama TaxID=30532 RepID=UPI002A368403|nr:uncharacterized protein LOC133068311 [Dama dama]XP_061015561.1 uncharacterized protein LOC133068311 [Dama dama]
MATTATAQIATGPTGGHPHTLGAPHSDPRIGSLFLESGALKAVDLWHSGLMRRALASWENPRTEVTQVVRTCRDHCGLGAELGPSPRKPGGSAWHPQALVGGQRLSPHRARVQRPRVLVSRRPPHPQDPERGALGRALGMGCPGLGSRDVHKEAPHTRIRPPQGSSIGTIHGGHQKLGPGLPSQRVRRPGTRQAGGPLCASLQGRALAPSPPPSLPPHPQPVLRAPLGRGGHREFGRGGLTLRLQWRSPPWLRAPPRDSRAQSCPVQLPCCTWTDGVAGSAGLDRGVWQWIPSSHPPPAPRGAGWRETEPGVSHGGDNHSVARPQPETHMSPLHPCPQDPLAGRVTLAGSGPLCQDRAQLQGGLEPEGLGVQPKGHQTWAERAPRSGMPTALHRARALHGHSVHSGMGPQTLPNMGLVQIWTS